MSNAEPENRPLFWRHLFAGPLRSGRRWWASWSCVLLLGAMLPVRQADAAGQMAVACDAPAAIAAWPRVHVTVTGIHRAAGNVTLTMYGDKAAAFLAHKGSIGIVRVMLAGVTADACLAVSSPGSYALAIYHDENNNHHFDRTLIGLPAEGYGFSNDAPTTFGLPAFSAVRFTVPAGGTRLVVRVHY